MGKKSWKIFRISLYSIVVIGFAFYWLADFHFKSNNNSNEATSLNEGDTSVRRWNEIRNQHQTSNFNWGSEKKSYDSIIFGMDFPTGGSSSLLGVLYTSKQSLLLLPWITLQRIGDFSTFDDYRVIVKNNNCYLSKKEIKNHMETYTSLKKGKFLR